MNKKLPQTLRDRLTVLFREVLALNWDQNLTYNRLSGAVFRELLAEANAGLTEDAAVDLAVKLTRKENLPALLASYDQAASRRHEQTRRQVQGIVNNLIAEDTPNREQVIADTLKMLGKFPLVRSIQGIRKLVQARIDNHHQDVDEDKFMFPG
jgi:hypothetical protein